ncbi:hypothetical protein Cgig2_001911 [Carnegiea gigantea]|uniref:Uncharacterized protein n=1 Tax=Carnegiea gigantea TaxID=171969 RepID=A0A9Q1QDF7_9CARY|nr:hypothetical protein Cgig2_001911 [Carnegiea gigantea]
MTLGKRIIMLHGHSMDPLDSLLDWGTYNLLEGTLIHTHLVDHEFDKIAQVVFQLHVHDEIPYKAKFLKEEGNEAPFKHLVISLNLNLAGLELKQGKFPSTITLYSLVLEFKPHNTKAPFRKVKVELDLHKVHRALYDLREAMQIEPNKSEIMKELAKFENEDCHFESCSMEVLDFKRNGRCALDSACWGVVACILLSVEHC